MNDSKDAKTQEPTRYVLGLMWRSDNISLVVIRKKKPAWQAGLLNGVGGKIEPGETELEAMIREFKEETGVDTAHVGWRKFCEMHGEGYMVSCFTAKNAEAWHKARFTEYEAVEKRNRMWLVWEECVPHLLTLIDLSLDKTIPEGSFATLHFPRH
jgi:8-oxo-dGTP diphosphatase